MGLDGGAGCAAIKEFVDARIAASLKDITMDFEIMESSMVPPSPPSFPPSLQR